MFRLFFKNTLGKNVRLIKYFSTSKIRNSCILDHSPNTKLDKELIDRYLSLPLPECKIQIEYVWIDGTGENIRSKPNTINFIPACPEEVPTTTFDGSSAFLAKSENSDVTIKPVALYNDPIRCGNSKIVLCDTYDYEKKPTPTNHRAKCLESMNCACKDEPLWGFEQEFQLMDVDGRPFGWPIMHGEPEPNGLYYCGVGAKYAYGREIIESHYRACLYAGIDLFGTNAEVTPSQWEYQVGTSEGIKTADDLWASRYLLLRIAEEYGVHVSFHPKLFPNWNGAGLHCNFSTKPMREDNGIKAIEDAVNKLGTKHKEHLLVYDPKGGEYNKLRLTGKHETSSMEKFSWAVASRTVSVRIPATVAEKKKGYFEDRRPASNADPYQICNAIINTAVLGK